MKIATSNKLAHYQVEFQELQEQTAMLNAQLPGLMQQMRTMESYLSVNSGDRKARTEYTTLCKRYNSTCTTIRRNSMRLQTLQRQITAECAKATYGRAATSMGYRTRYWRD